MFSVWSENAALFKRFMKIHLNPPILYYDFNSIWSQTKIKYSQLCLSRIRLSRSSPKAHLSLFSIVISGFFSKSKLFLQSQWIRLRHSWLYITIILLSQLADGSCMQIAKILVISHSFQENEQCIFCLNLAECLGVHPWSWLRPCRHQERQSSPGFIRWGSEQGMNGTFCEYNFAFMPTLHLPICQKLSKCTNCSREPKSS